MHSERVEEGFIDLVYAAFQSGRTGIPSDGYRRQFFLIAAGIFINDLDL